MFDFDSQFSGRKSARITATRGVERSEEHRRRDVYDSHRHRAFGIAYYMTGDEVQAEEILTETFVSAFSEADEPDGELVDAALVEALKARFPLDTVEAVILSHSHSGLAQRNVRRTELEEALRELPASERLHFLLRDVEGYSAEKIAELLKIPVAQVQRTLFSARIRLRNVLAEMGAERPAA